MHSPIYAMLKCTCLSAFLVLVIIDRISQVAHMRTTCSEL